MEMRAAGRRATAVGAGGRAFHEFSRSNSRDVEDRWSCGPGGPGSGRYRASRTVPPSMAGQGSSPPARDYTLRFRLCHPGVLGVRRRRRGPGRRPGAPSGLA
jgi:hypothetical protein